jgi:hypothetical protein
MEIEKKIRLAVIAGASHALELKRDDKDAFTDDLIQKTASGMSKILNTLGETRSTEVGKLLSLAAITGASQALNFSERNKRKSDKEILQHVTRQMEEIVYRMDLQEKQ